MINVGSSSYQWYKYTQNPLVSSMSVSTNKRGSAEARGKHLYPSHKVHSSPSFLSLLSIVSLPIFSLPSLPSPPPTDGRVPQRHGGVPKQAVHRRDAHELQLPVVRRQQR